MISQDHQVIIRRAGENDIEDILFVLTQCATEIPTRVDGEGREERFRRLIKMGCLGGHSYIAISGTRVVGFLLSTPNSNGWYELDYGAILADYRGMGLLSKMLCEIKQQAIGLFATVKIDNKSAMADRLLQAGFVEANGDTNLSDERAFRWAQISPSVLDSLSPQPSS
jgi:hypothetical protein